MNQLYEEQPCQVMVVDEQDSSRRQMRDILHGIGGFQVVAETTSCQMALEAVARVQIDLVIADLTLGDTDGIDLTTRLKQLPRPPQVIIFSSPLPEEVLLQVIMAGADGYLTKDTPTRDIIRAFKNFERGGPAMQPAVITSVIHLLVEHGKSIELKLTDDLAQEDRDRVAELLLLTQRSGKEMLAASLAAHAGTSLTHGTPLPPHLSPQEEKVFTLLRQGQRNKEIAAQLAISPYTVSKHVQNILRKLGVGNRTQAAAYTSNEV